MRNLVTVQTVSALTPIAGADRIESASILGWNIVVGKGNFAVGDKVAYFEVDSLLPDTDSRFDSFQERGKKVANVEGVDIEGHVLKTVRLRSTISQGLILGLSELGFTAEQIDAFDIGVDITDDLGVVKWEEPLPAAVGNIIGNFDVRFAPKSDAIRVQTLSLKWDEIVGLKWIPTVKADGTSQTIVNDGGNVRLFSRNRELSHAAPGYIIADEFGLVDAVSKTDGMAIQFELVGPGIQSNRLKLKELRPLVFALWQHGVKVPQFGDTPWPESVKAVAVPILGNEWLPVGTLNEMVEKVSGLRGNITRDVLDEGIVFHLAGGQEIPDYLGRNANFKIINNKFLLKHSI